MNLGSIFGEYERRIAELEERPPVQASPQPCPTCAAIRKMLARERMTPIDVDHLGTHETASAPDAPHVRTVRYGCISGGIVKALREAVAPLSAAEIGERTGIPANKVATNVWHLVRDGVVIRSGTQGRNGSKGCYRYALAVRDGESAAVPRGTTGA